MEVITCMKETKNCTKRISKVASSLSDAISVKHLSEVFLKLGTGKN